MEEQENNKISHSEFKAAFQHFYYKVKEYFEKRGRLERLSYLDICEYITGYLSDKGDVIDLDWYRNERDEGGFSEEILKKVASYCQGIAISNRFDKQQHFISEDEPLLE